MSFATSIQIAEDLAADRNVVETNHLHWVEFCSARVVCGVQAELVVNGWPLCERHAAKRLARALYDIQIEGLVRNFTETQWDVL